jgi:sugar phosphate isomerase/epimerase
MQIGAMNSPFEPVMREIARIGDAGFDFVDLTLEPPGAWPVHAAELGAEIERLGLRVVGHTAFFLPIASPYAELRSAAHLMFAAARDVFAALGAELVNVHPDPITRSYPRAEVVAANAAAVADLAEIADQRGLRLMVENLGKSFGTVAELGPLLEADSRIGFHYDAGHANLSRRPIAELVETFGDRLAHVHVSDNLGMDDLHLPLGAGSVPWNDVVAALRAADYDGTVTIEVFARGYQASSAALWREWWNDYPA